MRRELEGLVDNYTFEFATLPAGRKPILATWVYSWKANHLGGGYQGKARLVAQGFM